MLATALWLLSAGGCARAVEWEGAGGSASSSGGSGGTGTAGSGGATVTATAGGGGSGGTTVCVPAAMEACYDGPSGTQNVGLCKGGLRTCLSDGSGFGPCEGQVLPAEESCAAPTDEDCDGFVNDGCSCTPGSQQPCYSGPSGTQNIGVCKAGKHTCLADGSAFGPCEGEVVPGPEDCNTFLDDDCDGAVNESNAGCDPNECAGCVSSQVVCGSSVVVVGHYEGGSKTICIAKGDGSKFDLALVAYDPSDWSLIGETARVSSIQVYGFEAPTTIQGNGGIPTNVQINGSVPADPYDYSGSLGDCPAHTGYAGAVFGVPQDEVCHMETGLPGACGYPGYSCLAISP